MNCDRRARVDLPAVEPRTTDGSGDGCLRAARSPRRGVATERRSGSPANAARSASACHLSSARARVLTPQETIDRLDTRLKLASEGSTDAPQRHRTLRATVEWSTGLPRRPTRAALRRLSILRAPAKASASWLADCRTPPLGRGRLARPEPSSAPCWRTSSWATTTMPAAPDGKRSTSSTGPATLPASLRRSTGSLSWPSRSTRLSAPCSSPNLPLRSRDEIGGGASLADRGQGHRSPEIALAGRLTNTKLLEGHRRGRELSFEDVLDLASTI